MTQATAATSTRRKNVIMILSMLVTGFGIGWLMGLAVSPVASGVIATVAATAAAVVSALSGLDDKSRLKVNPTPIAIMLIGLVIGSLLGIWFRNSNQLARDLNREKARWISAGLAIDEAQIMARLFDAEYPTTGAQAGESLSSPVRSETVLFAVEVDECERLMTKETDALRAEMLTSTNPKIQKLAQTISDPSILAQVTQQVLCIAGP